MKPVLRESALTKRGRFFRTLPQQFTSKGNVMYVVAAGKGLRLSTREAPMRCCLCTWSLESFDPLLRHAKLLRVYGGPEGVSGWEVVLDDAASIWCLARMHPEGSPARGRSYRTGKRRGGDALAGVKATLKWQFAHEPNVLARQLQVDTEVISDALAMLGTRGLVGYDLADVPFFTATAIRYAAGGRVQPRLLNARKMVEEKAVRIVKRTGERVEAYVKGKRGRASRGHDGDEANCTCTWNVKHSGERGGLSPHFSLEISIRIKTTEK